MKKIIALSCLVSLTSFAHQPNNSSFQDEAEQNKNSVWALFEYNVAMRNLKACHENYKDFKTLKLAALKSINDTNSTEIREAVINEVENDFSKHMPDCSSLEKIYEDAKEAISKSRIKMLQEKKWLENEHQATLTSDFARNEPRTGKAFFAQAVASELKNRN